MNGALDIRWLLFRFEGRLRRRDWWLAAVGVYLCQALFHGLLHPLVAGPEAYSATDALRGIAPPLFDWRQKTLALVSMVLFAWPWLALAAKRVHDRGRQAGPVLIIMVLAAILGLAPGDLMDAMSGANPLDSPADWLLLVLGLAVTATKLWLLVIVGILDGTPGPNQFGPSPKASTSGAA